MTEKILTYNQAAAFLTIHRSTLYRLIANGKLKTMRVTNGRRAILQSELDKYLKSMQG